MRVPSLILVSLLLASCGSIHPSDQVRFADPDLVGRIEVAEPIPERTSEQLLKVQIPITNVSGEDLQLLVQVEFLDDAGNRYNDDTPRQPFMLARGQTKPIVASSMLSKANDFVVQIWRVK